jgi:hypothetical protein
MQRARDTPRCCYCLWPVTFSCPKTRASTCTMCHEVVCSVCAAVYGAHTFATDSSPRVEHASDETCDSCDMLTCACCSVAVHCAPDDHVRRLTDGVEWNDTTVVECMECTPKDRIIGKCWYARGARWLRGTRACDGCGCLLQECCRLPCPHEPFQTCTACNRDYCGACVPEVCCGRTKDTLPSSAGCSHSADMECLACTHVCAGCKDVKQLVKAPVILNMWRRAERVCEECHPRFRATDMQDGSWSHAVH